jgi:glycosyltransferase involved in cell wall biosynthesis
VSAPSRYVLDATREHYQIPLDGARVIPNCTRPVSAERQWAGGQSDSPVILFVGRFDAIKGGDLVLKAFNEVHKRSPDARLVFIGPDPGVRLADGHVCKFAEFVSRSLSAGASRRVEYLGRRSSTEIENWRQRASVTVLASRFDNFPNTALEAIAYGSPTVSTAVGGIPEILQNEVSGILVPPESAEALAAGILRLLDDHSLAMRLGRAAAADAHARFHPVSCAEQMLQAYFETLPARRISA